MFSKFISFSLIGLFLVNSLLGVSGRAILCLHQNSGSHLLDFPESESCCHDEIHLNSETHADEDCHSCTDIDLKIDDVISIKRIESHRFRPQTGHYTYPHDGIAGFATSSLKRINCNNRCSLILPFQAVTEVKKTMVLLL